jgi:hypothetical protein
MPLKRRLSRNAKSTLATKNIVSIDIGAVLRWHFGYLVNVYSSPNHQHGGYCLQAHTSESLKAREWVLIGSDPRSDGFVDAQ